jgi:hypothetical protein
MRTTVTLDEDTEQIVRARMKAKGISFKRALNDVIREGAARDRPSRFETPVFDMGVPQIDLTKALQLAGELEDEELIRKLRRGA